MLFPELPIPDDEVAAVAFRELRCTAVAALMAVAEEGLAHGLLRDGRLQIRRFQVRDHAWWKSEQARDFVQGQASIDIVYCAPQLRSHPSRRALNGDHAAPLRWVEQPFRHEQARRPYL